MSSRNSDIPLKTSLDVLHQKKACILAGQVIREVSKIIRPNISTIKLNDFCEERIDSGKGNPALKGYKGFPKTICTSVNNVAAHGIPCDYTLKKGDIITIDLTVEVEGWHGDTAWTFYLGEPEPEVRRLIKAAWKATTAGIRAAKAGGRLGDIGYAVTKAAGEYGCAVIEDLVGHGIGKNVHEDPVVLHTGEKGTGLPIVPGMVFTVEPILSLGKSKLKKMNDGWSLVTEDNSITAQFEQTVAVFGNRTEILTFNQESFFSHIDFPPFF